MYFVGIDISKFKHDCFIATETGHVIKDSFSFNNNQEGFNHFLKILLSPTISGTTVCRIINPNANAKKR